MCFLTHVRLSTAAQGHDVNHYDFISTEHNRKENKAAPVYTDTEIVTGELWMSIS